LLDLPALLPSRLAAACHDDHVAIK